jgi:hypothetical protein
MSNTVLSFTVPNFDYDDTDRELSRIYGPVERVLEASFILFDFNRGKYSCHFPALFSFEIVVAPGMVTIKSVDHHRVFFYAMVDELVDKLCLLRN